MRRHLVLAALLSSGSAHAAAIGQPTLDDLWAGRAHFEQVRSIDWTKAPDPQQLEQAGWYVVRGPVWYAFTRVDMPKVADCPADHWRVAVRESRDRGATWSAPAAAATPGGSRHGDGCSINDGTTFYDARAGVWHMLAQCLDTQNRGGWMLCHYTRDAASPMGRFVPDPANPVVRGGDLWRRLCAGGAVCSPTATHDEGTPEIVGERNGVFSVTFHGYEDTTKRGFRGIATTRDFRTWATTGGGLPGAPILSDRDCGRWVDHCVGFGLASAASTDRWTYLLGETADRSLGCTAGQQWVFALVRAPRGTWPRSGAGWRKRPGPPLIETSWPNRDNRCAVQYAHLLTADGATWLTYEDWPTDRHTVRRPLMKLVAGAGPATVRARD